MNYMALDGSIESDKVTARKIRILHILEVAVW